MNEPLTFQSLMVALSPHRIPILIWFLAVPPSAFVGGWLLLKINRKVAEYWFMLLIYLSAIPGTTAIVILFYLLFFTRSNLFKEMDLVLQLAPVFSFALTVPAIQKHMDLEEVPGFIRLSGFIFIIALTGISVLFLYKTRIFIGFFSSFEGLLLLFAGLFTLFKIAGQRAGFA